MSSSAFVAATAEGKVVVYELNVDKASFLFSGLRGVTKNFTKKNLKTMQSTRHFVSR